jgi:hypothetical protein
LLPSPDRAIITRIAQNTAFLRKYKELSTEPTDEFADELMLLCREYRYVSVECDGQLVILEHLEMLTTDEMRKDEFNST